MILFLDFDGVLHPDAAFLVNGKPELRAEGELFMWAPLLVDVLAANSAIRIVLSTSWVRELRFSRARSYLPDELAKRVIGATWHSAMARHPEGHHLLSGPTWWDHATRYQQIKRYIDRAGLQDWIAIDDNDIGWADADQRYLIHTQGNTGISDRMILDAISSKLNCAATV